MEISKFHGKGQILWLGLKFHGPRKTGPYSSCRVIVVLLIRRGHVSFHGAVWALDRCSDNVVSLTCVLTTPISWQRRLGFLWVWPMTNSW